MHLTIESYRSVLQPLETTIDREEKDSCDDIDLSTTDCGTGKSAGIAINQTTTSQQRNKDQLRQLTSQLEQMSTERQKLLGEKIALAEEKQKLSQMLERSKELQEQLTGQIEEMNSSRVGGVLIPTQEVESLNALLGQRETEILALTMEQ